MLTDKEIKEYQKIYKKEFGEEISKQKALEDGQRLVDFFDLLLKIDVRVNPNEYLEHTKNHQN